MEPRQHQSIYQLFHETAAAHADKVAYQSKRDDRWVETRWSEMRDVVGRVSKALIALGAEHGDRVCVLGRTRLEWVQSDFGINCCGCVTVGIYPSNLAADCAYIVNHSDAVAILVEDRDQLDKILEVRDELPTIRKIVIFDGDGDPDLGVLSWDEFLALGDAVDDERVRRRGAAIRRDDLASLVYTSGTTGVPKGVMITHGNLVFISWTCNQCLYMDLNGFVTLLFLPLAHVFARLIVYACLRKGVTIALVEDLATLPERIREVRPHFIPSVPRVFEKIHGKITSDVEAAGGLKQKLFNWALGVGRRVSVLQQRKQEPTGLLRLQHALAHKLVFAKIQAAMGGRLVYAVSGAAPLNQMIAEFFHACGVLILEGIGMTENTSFTNVNRIDNNKFGTVGPVGPGIEMKLADDGEVLYRGPNVMKGYFKNPEATAETIDADGWLHTGDIGEIDADGFLRITDRKKDLIVTAGGKNVAPQRIERIMRESHYIAQAVAYGDKRKYITALFSLDLEHVRNWADGKNIGGQAPEELAASPQVHELIEAEVEKLNRQLASFETVKRFYIVPRDFTVESGDLTPTMKIKRKVVYEKYADQLDTLYP